MNNNEYFWYFVGLMVSSPTNVLGLFLLLMVVAMLFSAQFSRRSRVDLAYVLVDSTIGNVTLAKFAGFGAFTTSTWVIVAQVATGKFDEGAFTIYLATWGIVKVASDFAKTSEGKQPDGNTLEETSTRREITTQSRRSDK